MKRLGIGVAIVLLLLVVIAATVLGSRPSAPAPSSMSTSVLRETAPEPDAITASGSVGLTRPLTRTTDADAYAVAIADVVFGLDTRDRQPADYLAQLLAEADPGLSATGRADLDALVAMRIPADELWQRMRTNRQWSTFEAGDVWEPGSWEQVVTSGQAEPGWALRNVTGIQTTHYVEDGVERTSSRERTITIGMRCPADGADVDRCRLVLVGSTVVP